MKHKHTINCKKCGKEFEIECTDFAWNKGKYNKHCSRSCSNSHIYSDELKQKISEGIKKHNEKVQKEKVKQIYEYVCDKCGKKFTSDIRLRKDRKKCCDNCKRKVVHYKEDFSSITDLSKRTISKILKRANKECQLCGWNESSCDIHHIIPRKDGGSNDTKNLIVVCPNCHRILHTIKDKYSIEFLLSKSIFYTFKDWKEYYHTER